MLLAPLGVGDDLDDDAFDDLVRRAERFWHHFTWGRRRRRRRRMLVSDGAPSVLVDLAPFYGVELLGEPDWWGPRGLVLCCDPEGRRLYLAAPKSGFSPPDEMVWGLPIAAIHYRVKKGAQLATWRHPFDAPLPRLSLAADDMPVFVGGGYEVTWKGIER